MIIPSFLYINNSLHLPRKYARIFVRGHYLFREANSFPRAKLEENCEFRGTDNVQGQICKHIFAANEGYCVYYPSVLFLSVKKWYHLTRQQFLLILTPRLCTQDGKTIPHLKAKRTSFQQNIIFTLKKSTYLFW